MHIIHRHKIIVSAILLMLGFGAYAQPNLEQYDNRALHFGFTLSTNIGRLRVDRNTGAFPSDTLKNVSQVSFPGIGLGVITNLHLGNHFDLRLLAPVISFVQRNLQYEFEKSKKETEVESAYCDASLQIKFKSDRRKNTRVYVLSGLRASYDLSSTVKQNRSNQKPVVSLKPFTYGYEFGAGLDMYFEYFKFSPEIKFCNTFGSAMYKDGFIYTELLHGLTPQLIQISLHFEG
ncbi:MAG: porin family protein [Bacteroidota bacterium]